MIIALIGAVQFVNILDFMMVMPLGPDFAKGLHIPISKLGFIAGSYTAAAAVSGIAGAFFLDRFDRRKALAVAMLGLVTATAAGALATSFHTLLATRLLAGTFGGPATSLSWSIIADTIPGERRGKAIGQVLGAFAVATVLGVPAGLELARLGSWRLPFIAVGGLGFIVAAGAIRLMPPMRQHLVGRDETGSAAHDFFALLSRPLLLMTLALTFVTMFSLFVLVPNLSAYLQHNLGYPRPRMGLLYLVGGTVSFVSMRAIGGLVDRVGATRVLIIGTGLLLCDLYFGFVAPVLPALALFTGMMFAMSFRNVSFAQLSAKVPLPHERASFMSLQSAVQHIAAAFGAFVSAQLLTERPDQSLVGMPVVASVAMAVSVIVPLMLWRVEVRVRARDALTPQVAPA